MTFRGQGNHLFGNVDSFDSKSMFIQQVNEAPTAPAADV
jgi:hypothetical protein